MDENFFDSECVSCGACVSAAPTATLSEKSVIEIGTPDRAFENNLRLLRASAAPSRPKCAAMEVVRMVPNKDGKANAGHSCVKGRFAWGTRPTRSASPGDDPRFHHDPWREVTWEEAISHTASEFRRIQAKYGKNAIGGITSRAAQ